MNRCIFCTRTFKFKDLYTQHVITCEFLHQSPQAQDRELDAFEQVLPTPQEMFKLVQHLAQQNMRMEKEIEKLKSASNARRKKMLLEWLNQPSTPKPTLTFLNWAKLLPVTHENVLDVCSSDLTTGIKNCLRKWWTANPDKSIRSFTQKKGQLYIYHEDETDENVSPKKQWRLMTHDEFGRWVDRISHRFIQEFLIWQTEHKAELTSSEDKKQKNIENMRKINDISHDEKRKTELKKWMCIELEEQPIVEYDIV